MGKLERPEWYAKAAVDPLRKNMFTQTLKQQIHNRVKEEEPGRFKRRGALRKFAAATGIGIAMVALAVFIWANVDADQWFATKSGTDPSEHAGSAYPADLSAWDEELVYQFLNEVEQFVRDIPIETTSTDPIIEKYEAYFSPDLSREIVNALYMETEGKWMIPDGDGAYMFVVPNQEQNEVSIQINEGSIVIEENYEFWMYTKIQYVITYDKKPVISEWIRFNE